MSNEPFMLMYFFAGFCWCFTKTVVSRTSNTLPSFQQSLTTSNTSSSKFGLEFGWWKDRPPLLLTTRWPPNYQCITLTITFPKKNPPMPTRLVLLKTCHNTRSMKNVLAGIQDSTSTSSYLQISVDRDSCQLHQERLFIPFLASLLPEVSAARSNHKPATNRLMCSNDWVLSFI